MHHPLVSVVIPVVAADDSLGECVDAVLRQRYDSKELVVSCAQQQALPVPEQGKAVRLVRLSGTAERVRLINAGLKAATGSVKVLLMPNCVPVGERWLEALIRPLEDERVAAAVSQCSALHKREMGLGDRLTHSVAYPELKNRPAQPSELQLVSHLCDAYRADVLQQLGYMDEKSFPSPGEAIDLSVRIRSAGYRIVLNTEAAVHYYDPPENRSLLTVLRKALDYGYSDAVLGKSYNLEWLGSGRHLAALLALLLLPLGLLSLPYALIAAAALFAWGWFLPLRTPVLRWEWPVAVLNLAVYVAIIMLVRDEWLLGLFDRRLSHPAIIRQWCALAAMTASYLLILLQAGVRSAVRSIIDDGTRLAALPLVPLSILWSLASGVGYLKGSVFGQPAGR
jgi:GT2 family glycosyltransferase